MAEPIPTPGRLAYSDRDLDDLGILSRKTRWRWRRDGTFPEPSRCGGRNLYRASDVRLWLKLGPEEWAKRQRGQT